MDSCFKAGFKNDPVISYEIKVGIYKKFAKI